MKKTNKKGFTLVELVIVIAVLAILAAIAIPTIANIMSNANQSAAQTNGHQVQAAINSYLARIEAGMVTDANPKIGEALADYGVSDDVLDAKGHWVLQYNANHEVVAVENGTQALTTASDAVAPNTTSTTSTSTDTSSNG